METKITRRRALKMGMTAAVVGTVGLTPRISKAKTKFKWRMQSHWPVGVAYYKLYYEGFANRVREATNGEVDITPLPPGSIVPTKDVLEAVGRGLFEIAMTWPAYWIGKLPVAGHLNGQLFTWNDFESMWGFLYQMGAIKPIEDAYAEQGVKLLPPYPCGTLSLYSRKPVRSLEDFKGLKVRSTGIPAAVFQKAGATPVFFPGEELYQALQTGVVDAAHWGGVAAGWDMKLQEVTKYIVMPPLGNVTNGDLFINLKLWNSLPSDIQRVLYDCGAANAADCHAWFVYHDYTYMNEFTSKKMGEVSTIDPESVKKLRAYSMEVVDEYSQKDPKYSGKVGAMLKEYLKLTNVT